MLVDMNSHLQQPLDKAVLQTAFIRGWHELKEALDKVPKVVEPPQPKDKVELMLEEILNYVRQQSRRDEQAINYPGLRKLVVDAVRSTGMSDEAVVKWLNQQWRSSFFVKDFVDPPREESDPKQPDQ